MPTSVIVPDEKQNNGEGKDSKNLFFTGDNLEVLRHLQANYTGKIDVIYIDPPYNTGNGDFVYPDNFDYTDSQLKEMFGLDADEVERMKSIQGSSSHSAWLTFMYPRLVLAKKLLASVGVVLVSIDDNEQSNLYQLLSDIFGESEIDTMIWNKESEGSSGSLKAVNRFKGSHEYVLIAYKFKAETKFNQIHEALKGREKELVTANLAVNQSVENKNHPNFFTITNPSGDSFTRQWKWNKEKIDALINENLIYWGSDGHKQPRLIIPLDERRTIYLNSILNYGSTTQGRVDFEALFGNALFSYPKPVVLLKKLLEAVTSKESIILDFFAGSSTTADAVMQLNAEDGGNRKFIMVQLPEKTYTTNKDGKEVPTKGGKAAYDAGFRSIDEISRERIRRAAVKIKEEKGSDLPENFDGSFKHYRVVKPNTQTLKEIDDFDPNAIDLFNNMLDNFSSEKLNLPGNTTGEETVLTTWLAADGYSFDADIKELKINDYIAHIVENNRLYLIKDGWTAENTKTLINLLGTNQLAIQSIVLFGYSFNIAELRELENALKQLDANVNLIKRY
ncbi:site-specific DNA-methyltransferase [Lactobacillus psittaci]|uniref:DNA (Cytosine-5-)-methyltransferase n=1 Tax=Lactobacillus psittaci DSM 15354 TaxID=1122152 RepID=A0A0R1S1S9_9LACO|nr:DNA (cytosine-5-)-methyltransferase [Lactobacillus psittaci DSM 15354]